jgi:hypothetical protein
MKIKENEKIGGSKEELLLKMLRTGKVRLGVGGLREENYKQALTKPSNNGAGFRRELLNSG